MVLFLILLTGCSSDNTPIKTNTVITQQPGLTYISIRENLLPTKLKSNPSLTKDLTGTFPEANLLQQYLLQNKQYFTSEYHFYWNKNNQNKDFHLVIGLLDNRQFPTNRDLPDIYHTNNQNNYFVISTKSNYFPTVIPASGNAFATIYSIDNSALFFDKKASNYFSFQPTIEELNFDLLQQNLDLINTTAPINFYQSNNQILINLTKPGKFVSPPQALQLSVKMDDNFFFNSSNLNFWHKLLPFLDQLYINRDDLNLNLVNTFSYQNSDQVFSLSLNYPDPATTQKIYQLITENIKQQKIYQPQTRKLTDDTDTILNSPDSETLNPVSQDKSFSYQTSDQTIHLYLDQTKIIISNQATPPEFSSSNHLTFDVIKKFLPLPDNYNFLSSLNYSIYNQTITGQISLTQNN